MMIIRTRWYRMYYRLSSEIPHTRTDLTSQLSWQSIEVVSQRRGFDSHRGQANFSATKQTQKIILSCLQHCAKILNLHRKQQNIITIQISMNTVVTNIN